MRSFSPAPLGAANCCRCAADRGRAGLQLRSTSPRTANDSQAAILLKLLRRNGPPLAPGKASAPGSSLTKTASCSRSAGMIASGMPTTRRPAFDFGGRGGSRPLTARRMRRAPVPSVRSSRGHSGALRLLLPSGGWRRWSAGRARRIGDRGGSRPVPRRSSSTVPAQPQL